MITRGEKKERDGEIVGRQGGTEGGEQEGKEEVGTLIRVVNASQTMYDDDQGSEGRHYLDITHTHFSLISQHYLFPPSPLFFLYLLYLLRVPSLLQHKLLQASSSHIVSN